MTVEIIGRAAKAPGANSPEDLFELLRQRRCMVTQIPADRWDLSRYWHPAIGTRGKTYSFAAGIVDDCFSFDAGVFGISQREAQLMDPQQRMILELTWQAFESANIDFTDLREQRVGVYVGASALDHGNLVVEDPAAAGPYFMTGNTLSIVSNRISHTFGLHGPSLTVDTACSSSLVALDLAVKALEAGQIDTAIVGGVNALTHPLAFVGFAQARMLSPEGLCRAYDEDGMGYVRAEGGAVVILRMTEAATANGDRSFARIVASAVNSAGRTNGISLPSETAQARLLRSLYNGGGVDTNRVAFIEGHGTGTKVGDPSEVWSIGTVVGATRRAPIPIGSIKTNIGHAEPASGLLGLMKAVLSLENNFFPASLHFETPNKNIDFDGLNVHVASEPIELLHGKHPRLAGINSFGFGGTNAHVIISDPQPQKRADGQDVSGKVFFASAHTASALDGLLRSYRETLTKASAPELKPMIAAAGANRHHLKHRFVIASDDAGEIVRTIDRQTRGREVKDAVRAEAPRDNAKVAFVFSGNGSQWAGMGVDAHRTNTAFRDRFNVVHALFQVRSKIDLIALLSDPELDAKLADTKIAQPLLFAIQASLADVLGNLGVKPDAVFGHSVGEVAAAYVSGAISLVDAVAVVAKRSFHQDRLAGMGKMAVMQLSAEDATAYLDSRGLNEIQIAAINARGSVSVSGPSDQILALKAAMKADRVVGQVLDINYPFHHPLIEIAKDDFLADMAQIALRPTQIPFISTVTGDVFSGERLDAGYWWENVRKPVQFHQATVAALELGCGLFVEIGPRPILLAYLRDTVKDQSAAATVIASLVRDGEVRDPLWHVYSRVLANGGAFDRSKAFGRRNTGVRLPALKLEPIDMRHEFTSDAIDLYGRMNAPVTLAGWRVDPTSGNWKNHIDARLFPDLADHVVDGKPIIPGSAFLDIAISAARQFLGGDAVEITNLEIVRPLDLSDTLIREISTVISRDTGDIEIRSRERLSSDDWTIHAVARCRKSSAERPEPVAAPAAAVGANVIGADAAYETARQFGLDYGPAFRLLKSAVRKGPFEVEARLKAPAASGNPFVTYSLHPISVDAAFHGLVAVFATLSGAARGAPYIPVRFGSVRVFGAAETIERALIRIDRVSANSLQVGFTLVGKAGSVVAILDDCRFKRTFLRQHKALDAVSFYETSVPSALARHSPDAVAASNEAGLPSLFPARLAEAPDNAQQMLGGAVYRACHDIARKASRNKGVLQVEALPGDTDFQRFVASCLHLLEDVGLATENGGAWTLPAKSNLPAVSAILNALYRERPDQIAELVAINDVHARALRVLDEAHGSPRGREAAAEGPLHAQVISEALLESMRVHSASIEPRIRLAQDALAGAIASGDVGHVVEIGSVATAVTRAFARRVVSAGGRLTVVEPRESAFSELSLAFENAPQIMVLRPADLGSIAPADVIVSASDEAFEVLAGLGRDTPSLIGPTTRIALCAPAPSAFADFAFGMNAGWFDRSTSVEFPIGKTASVDDWRNLLRRLGIRHGAVTPVELASGPLLTIEGMGSRLSAAEPEGMSSPIALILHEDGVSTVEQAAFGGAGNTRWLLASPALDADAVIAALPASGDVNVVFRPVIEPCRDGSFDISATIMTLARAADILATFEAGSPSASRKVRLGVVAGAGQSDASNVASHARIRDEGLRAYLRVLRNEYETIEVHAFEVAESRAAAGWLSEIARLMSSLSGNREWIVGPSCDDIREMRVAPGHAADLLVHTTDFESATVRQTVSSQVGSIVWETCAPAMPGPDEVGIAIEATGLNFRDVMWAMGMLPEEALEDGFAGATIGMECAGRVHAVGSGVTDLKVGDTVMAVASAAFSTHVCVKRSGVAKLPTGLDPVAGATLPVAFLTAYYSLVELARIRPGETVLIHGGAGGVGLAALQIAKAQGARVFATAGSTEKRQLLLTLGADRVFNSRTLDFADEIMAETGNVGVDIVLNSLFSEAMERSLSLVKPFGRFLELGKRDFFADTKLGLRPFRRNISYFGIDADQLLNAMPELSGRLLGEISGLFEKGDLAPLPYRAFRHDEITSAFRLMQSSGHIGKIVVRPPVRGRDHVQRAPLGRAQHSATGVHLVLGGIGGFGLAAANWLVEGGARKLALCTRRGIADAQTSDAIRQWAARGVTTTLHACDATNQEAVSGLLDVLRARGPLKTVLHAAMVLDDALIPNLTEDRVRAVVDPKAGAAAILDRLTRQDALDAFILFSSVTTLFGNPGQANYVAANGCLEGLARERRRAGLPALAVGFGAITDTGFLARNAAVNATLSKRIGKMGMTAVEALAYMDDYIARDANTVDAAVVSIAEIDMAMAGSLATVASPLFDIVARSAKSLPSSGDGDQIDLSALIAGKTSQEAEQAIFQLVAGEIAAILRVPVGEITPVKIIKDAGLDSLMAMELGMSFRQKTGYDMPLSSITQSTTVGDVAQKLYLKVVTRENVADGGDEEKPAGHATVVDYLAARHTTATKGSG